jgi:F-type H+-transporting ATPase subunit delta
MANLSSIARPYARAAFECAHEKGQLLQWKAFLEAASCAAREPSIVKWLASPSLSSAKLFDLFHDVLAPLMDTERKNFLLLLVQNKRLMALPEIADLFNLYYASLEKTSTVRLVSAVDVDDALQHKLAAALTKRIKHEVKIHCEIDPSIIGGAIIHIGDRVIDGSVRGKLSRLLQDLTG